MIKVPNAIKGRDSTDVEIFGMEGIPQQDLIAHQQAIESGQPIKKIRTEEPVELSSEEIKKQLAQHQAMMQNAPSTTTSAVTAAQQSFPFSSSTYSTSQSQAIASSLMPHQYSQFYQRPNAYHPYRPNIIPGQPWRPPISAVNATPLYGGAATTGIFPHRPIVPNVAATATTSSQQIYPPPHLHTASGQPFPTTYGGISTTTASSSTITAANNGNSSTTPIVTSPTSLSSGDAVGILSDTITSNSTAVTSTVLQKSTQQTTQKLVPKVVLVYSDNEISMEEKRAELEKYRFDESLY